MEICGDKREHHIVETNVRDEYTEYKCLHCSYHRRYYLSGRREVIDKGYSAEAAEYFAYLHKHQMFAELAAETRKLPTHSGAVGGMEIINIEGKSKASDDLDIWRDALCDP